MRLSRILRHFAALSVCLLAQLALVRAGEQQLDPQPEADSSSPAAAFVHEALVAEAAGEVDRRAAYLADALAADPDYAPAHWHSGEMRRGDSWQSINASADATRRAGKVAKYREQRVHDNNLRQVTTATVPGLVNP